MKKIVTLLSKELIDRAKEQLNLELIIRDSAKNYIVENGYDKKYGGSSIETKNSRRNRR